ncbi:hypothetical protein [Raoultibacter phocaeensis]|uniref:hypothetical protein n=1 Tax=Raoultibacter phocaeensis TaxID=2479841 RepID=UPI00111ADEAC|nr:hypothetical protein [Raoultibacter phocaeensis]
MQDSAFEQQDRASFVEALVGSLIECGDGRYEHLRLHPIVCVDEEARSWLVRDGKRLADVSWCSLPTIGLVVLAHA